MILLITGGSGLIGSALVKQLRDAHHEVRVLSRSTSEKKDHFLWDVNNGTLDEKALTNIDGIIHLAGASIGERWTEDYKKELYRSRIDSARLLLNTCEKLKIKLKFFISASGINYYGTFTSNHILTEQDDRMHADFLAQLSADWEHAAYQFSAVAERIVCLRTAMVLAKDGGSFPLLKKITDYNLGAPVGSGVQFMNWIHIEDLVDMYHYCIDNTTIYGNYNAVAEDVVQNKVFMKKLAAQSGKFFLPLAVPGFILKVALGEMASIILEGTRASNEKIRSAGFTFRYSTYDEALRALLQ